VTAGPEARGSRHWLGQDASAGRGPAMRDGCGHEGVNTTVEADVPDLYFDARVQPVEVTSALTFDRGHRERTRGCEPLGAEDVVELSPVEQTVGEDEVGNAAPGG
jgi:hypothetical protein